MPVPALDESERRLAASIAANVKWSQTADRTAATEPARSAFIASFERQVDPDGLLDDATRTRLAENARRAHYQRLALASAKARRKGKAAS